MSGITVYCAKHQTTHQCDRDHGPDGHNPPLSHCCPDDDRQCANPGCTCAVDGHAIFCSETCTSAFAKRIIPVLGTCENILHDGKPQEWHERNPKCIGWHPGPDRLMPFMHWDHTPIEDSLAGDPVVILALSDYDRLFRRFAAANENCERLKWVRDTGRVLEAALRTNHDMKDVALRDFREALAAVE